MTLTAPIWFCCAFFRMSTMICFSCFCSDALSRSSSRMALSSNLLFSRRISASCFRFRSATSRSRRAFLPWARFSPPRLLRRLTCGCFSPPKQGRQLHLLSCGCDASARPRACASLVLSLSLSVSFSHSSVGPTSMSVLPLVRISPFFVSVFAIGCGPGMGCG